MQGDSSELPHPFETPGTPYATKHLRAAALIGGWTDSLTALRCSPISGLRWWVQISMFILGGFIHANSERSSPFLECGHRKGKLFAWSPQVPWERLLFVIGQSALFSRCGKDAKITLHLRDFDFELYEYFSVSVHASAEWQIEGAKHQQRLSG